ncbi:MAG: 4-diphosphocytidyl-2-C-methyl-D-erythritol kinase [Chitinophagales bacterium]|jgi:4-diphosphocytidyl-2-C-methyl-D-erythritol kinase
METTQLMSALQTLIAPAPAKLNLFLHITGRRPNGYHELQTLFQLIDYGDELQFELTNNGIIRLADNLAGVAAADNLVYRAASALKQCANVSHGATIRLHKKLPTGGGLGGGSSDAATTLLALNKLWHCGLSLSELASIALTLGADVPVFIHGRTAWAEGIGEKLTPVVIPAKWYLVIHPKIMVSTAAVFGHKNLTRNSQAITLAAFLEGQGRNDCESVVRSKFPAVDKALNWLCQYAKPSLTGTGACIFAEFSDKESAQTVLADLPLAWQGFIACGVNSSPAHSALGY